ncbi:nitroreductase family protein [Parabacteroides sp. PF5-9]|uniref:nitroreductase family protein n=1 Tax=Parabacteroides sp. PF5-9 TaxID=1742404 RepID=UPI002476E61F|nr:nitroreductase family protein [Parabacteroides sp. PF5-9]MDH6356800.1 nitroreductase [Parabacteroides sp. PF5-9]
MLESMKNRRSIRKYTDQDISDTLLNELVEIAARSSNTGNMQLYSVIINRDMAKKTEQAPLHFNQKMVTEAPVFLTFCADANRFVKWAQQRKAEPGFDNLQMFMAAMLDATIFAQSFCDAAEAKGLGICYLGTTLYNADKIIEQLNLPKLVIPIVSVAVGYPAEPLPSQVERLPLDAIIHKESYTDYTPDAIDKLYQAKEELEVNKQYTLENDKETLAQVFTDIRYTKKNNEYFSEVLMDVLQKQGFLK